MQLLLDMVKLAVHVLDFATETAAVVVLLAAAELITYPVRFVTDMLVLSEDMTISAVTTQLALHVCNHLVQMVHFVIQAAAALADLLAAVGTRIVGLLIIGALIVLVFLVSGNGLAEAGESKAGKCDGQNVFVHNVICVCQS